MKVVLAWVWFGLVWLELGDVVSVCLLLGKIRVFYLVALSLLSMYKSVSFLEQCWWKGNAGKLQFFGADCKGTIKRRLWGRVRSRVFLRMTLQYYNFFFSFLLSFFWFFFSRVLWGVSDNEIVHDFDRQRLFFLSLSFHLLFSSIFSFYRSLLLGFFF